MLRAVCLICILTFRLVDGLVSIGSVLTVDNKKINEDIFYIQE